MTHFVETPSIVLTAREEKIFQVLRDTVTYHERSTVLRVAGGWVRDKLLGVESNDIDIATDDCMGEEFALAVKEYLSSKAYEDKSGDHLSTHQLTGGIGVISANPEQSKHLETATMKIFDQEIDFVNLRSEEYSDTTSRIPTIQFGTPEQDAYRRDFTINSLFYNIMTKSVEDYTHLGIEDMQMKLIRTPLHALTTLHDDPLRLLRAVRFASRYHFCLHEDIVRCGQMPEVHIALQQKISKERLCKEVSGCFSGASARPLFAISMVHNLKFFEVIFAPPSLEQLTIQHASVNTDSIEHLKCGLGDGKEKVEKIEASVASIMETWQTQSLLVLKAVNLLLQMELASHELSLFAPQCTEVDVATDDPIGSLAVKMSHVQIDDPASTIVVTSSEQLQPLGKGLDTDRNSAIDSLERLCSITGLLWASCVAGVRDIRLLTEKKRVSPLYTAMLMDCFKLGNVLLKNIDSVLANARHFEIFATALQRHQSREAALSTADLREDLGVTLRSCKHAWRASLLMACAMELSSLWSAEDTIGRHLDCLSGDVTLKNDVGEQTSDAMIIVKYQALYDVILRLGLDSVWTSVTPTYHGKALLNELNIRPGPVVGLLMDFQFRWQLRNPLAGKDECLAALKAELERIS